MRDILNEIGVSPAAMDRWRAVLRRWSETQDNPVLAYDELPMETAHEQEDGTLLLHQVTQTGDVLQMKVPAQHWVWDKTTRRH
jgi:hypothetical protein